MLLHSLYQSLSLNIYYNPNTLLYYSKNISVILVFCSQFRLIVFLFHSCTALGMFWICIENENVKKRCIILFLSKVREHHRNPFNILKCSFPCIISIFYLEIYGQQTANERNDSKFSCAAPMARTE